MFKRIKFPILLSFINLNKLDVSLYIQRYSASLYITIFYSFFNQLYYTYNKGLIFLSWPGRQILPSFLFEQGKLSEDFYTKSAAVSQYQIVASTVNKINIFTGDNFLSLYSVLSIILYIVVILLASILLTKFTIASGFFSEKDYKKNENNLLIYFSFILNGYLTFVPYLNIKYLFTGVDIAGFSFPLMDQLNPGGISFLLIEILSIMLLNGAPFISKGRRFLFSLIFILSVIIHPVVPLFLLILNTILLLLNSENLIQRKKRAILLVFNLFIYVLTLFFINLYFFKETSISSIDLFNIYIKDRHPHHYLPSNYLSKEVILLFLINNFILLVIYLLIKNAKVKNTILLAFLLVISIHTFQYIGVEYFKSKYLIILGISRLSGIYKFLYMSIVGFVIISTINNIKISTLFNNILTKKLFYFSICLTIIFLIFHFNYTKEKIKSSNSRALFNTLKINKIPSNTEIIVDYRLEQEFEFLREIGSLNVFSDEYFPFSMEHIKEWQVRKDLKDKLLKNGLIDSSLINQINKIAKNNMVLFISPAEKTNLQFISKLKIKNSSTCYIYKL